MQLSVRLDSGQEISVTVNITDAKAIEAFETVQESLGLASADATQAEKGRAVIRWMLLQLKEQFYIARVRQKEEASRETNRTEAETESDLGISRDDVYDSSVPGDV